jgi:ribosomal protein S18 acetylase RimI-like enzyme
MTDQRDLSFRRARRDDLAAIIDLLANDPLGRQREVVSDPPDPAYVAAFEAIDSDPNQLLAVGTLVDGTVAGCLQITFIPALSHQGQWRGQIESVRVAEAARGRGAGRRMLEWAIAACAERGCGIVQLTSDKTRGDAIRFYEQLGFAASHEGLKLKL